MVEDTPSQLLQRFARKRCFASGQNVFQLGHQAKAIFRVISGEVQLYRYDVSGHRVLLHRAFSGNFFAEASLNVEQYHCTAICARDSEVEVFNSARFRSLLDDSPSFQKFWIEHLSTELRRQRASVERLSLKSAADRVVHYLMTEGEPAGELKLQGTVSELADMLGLSRESLYRTLSKMKKNKTLQQQGTMLKLNFPSA
jgi:CRP-like cAMP-binding protein